MTKDDRSVLVDFCCFKLAVEGLRDGELSEPSLCSKVRPYAISDK